MLAWQNKTSLLKQPKQVNNVIKKKKTITRGVSSKLTTRIPSPTNIFSRSGSNEPFFPNYVRRQETFVIICHIKRSLRKNGHPLKTINHHQFWTKYSNRLANQPLSKQYRIKLDLDGLREARSLRIYRESNQTSVGPFSLLWSKIGDVCKSWPFSSNY